MPEIERREIWQVIGISILVLAISSVPYVLGYLTAGPGLEFGGFLIDLDDSYSYLAKMQQGVWDGWTYRIPFTPEEHPGAYLYTFYLGLGKLSSLLGLSVIQTYHLARLGCGLSLLVTAYVFVSMFFDHRDRRLVAYLLISLSSGLGWLILLVGGPSTLSGVAPIDFWWIEAYTFLAILTFPHFAAALTLLLLFFTLALRYLESFHLPALVLSIPAFVALCIVHPYNAFLVDGVLAAYWVLLLLKRKRVPRREALAIAIWAITPIPLLAYYYLALSSDPVFQSWAAQTFLPSPGVPYLILGYGLVFLMAIGGLAHVIRKRDERSTLLVAWVTSIVVLTYLPLSFQRKMIEGLHIPLCILATIGLFEYVLPTALDSSWLNRFAHWRGYNRQGLRRLLLYSIIIATFPSNLYLLAETSSAVLLNNPVLYYASEEVEAIDWLKENTQRADTLLASYKIGTLVPARAGNTVFMGHIIETVQVERKKELAERFFQAGTSDDFRRRLLKEYEIAYVFHGPRERQLGEFDPSEASYLTPAYSDSSVAVYRVDLE
jgi:hypothetical protein